MNLYADFKRQMTASSKTAQKKEVAMNTNKNTMRSSSDGWIPIYDKSDLLGFYMAVGTHYFF